MRIPAATALLLALGGVPVQAQFGGLGGTQQRPAPRREENVQVKLLEIAQEVDETLLREAMLKLGRLDMTPKPDHELADKRKEAEKDALAQLIKQKTQAITERAAELAEKRAESMGPSGSNARVNRPDTPEKPGRSEEIEKARVEVQLLQTQAEFSQQALTNAISELAQAELMAGDDESQRQKVEAARKQFEKVKSVHLEYKKRLKAEFTKLNALEPQPGLGGMRGGMGGMGAGMR